MDVRRRPPQGEPGVVVIIGQADGKVSVVAATNDEARRSLLARDSSAWSACSTARVRQGRTWRRVAAPTSRIDEALALVAREVDALA